MYEEFYGLKEKPFSLTPDPRFFFLSDNHRAAFEHLLYGIREKEGFILITGEVGAGKTTLCRALLAKLESDAVDSALILNPMFSGQELIQAVLSDFGAQSRGNTKKEVLDELNRFLLSQKTAGRNSILIIDEAQNLPLPVLEEIRILSNLETEKEKLLQIILMGQVELKQVLAMTKLRQLNQRISIRYHLQPLKKDEVPRYIHHRLTVAGSSGDVHFAPNAFREIYRFSQGIPRLINLAADRALLAGYAGQSHEINRATVARGLKSLLGEETFATKKTWNYKVVTGVVGLSIFLLGLIVGSFIFDLHKRILEQSGVVAGRVTTAPANGTGEVTGGEVFYTVELGAYETDAEIQEIAKRVKETGYPLFVGRGSGSDGATKRRVYLGKFSDKAQAEELERTFRKVEGFAAARVVSTSSRESKKGSP
jgi:general secretion pathway protein A